MRAELKYPGAWVFSKCYEWIMHGWGTEWPCLAVGVSEGSASFQVRMSHPSPPPWCCGEQAAPKLSGRVPACLPVLILYLCHPVPTGRASSGWLRDGIRIRPSLVSRINQFSFKLLVSPQSIELGPKFWNLFSKMTFQLGIKCFCWWREMRWVREEILKALK